MTPMIFETTSTGRERAYDIYSFLMRDRTIFLKEPIEDDVANTVAAQLTYLDGVNRRKPIDLYINSPGGVVTDLLAMYDAINFITAPVRTTCIGQACSAAAVLLLSGEKGMRAALPNARIMLHQVRGGTWGTLTDAKIALEEMERLNSKIYEIVALHTGQSLTTVREVMARDKWMSAAEARDFGIIDEIITTRTYSVSDSED